MIGNNNPNQPNTGIASSVSMPQMEPSSESIPRSILPWNFDDDRSRYLGFRCSGFTTMEAIKLLDVAKSTLSAWRHTVPGFEKFNELESDIPQLRKKLALEYSYLEYLRNFRLIMEKDKRVIMSSLENEVLPKQDHDYLLRMRSNYGPEKLQLLQSLMSDDDNKQLNLTDVFYQLSRTTVTEKVSVLPTGTRSRGEPIISKIVEVQDGRKVNPKEQTIIQAQPDEAAAVQEPESASTQATEISNNEE
jgi:hypothetical protein